MFFKKSVYYQVLILVFSVNLCGFLKDACLIFWSIPVWSSLAYTCSFIFKFNIMLHLESAMVHKQPSRSVLRKSYSENMQQIYRRTPIPNCDFNKVTLQLYWNHTSSWVFSCKMVLLNGSNHPNTNRSAMLTLLVRIIPTIFLKHE